MKRLVFATRNRGKLVELRDLLGDIEVVAIDEVAPELPDVIEDADSFRGNATKKAREVSAATGLPALADDSGLEVDALGGAPGVYSARYAGAGHDDAANNAKLVAALAGIAPERRTARFRACLVLADVAGPLGDGIIVADGTCEGVIALAPRGTSGFGFDPLFLDVASGKTFGELDLAAKRALSHRARAMRAIEPELRAYLRNR